MTPKQYNFIQNIVGGDKARHTFVNEYIRPYPLDRLLDLGCGTGLLLDYLPPIPYVGYDTNKSHIEYAKGQYGDKFTSNSESIKGMFDIIVAIGLLHHLNDYEAHSILKFAQKKLEPGGRLLTLDGFYHFPQSKLEQFIMKRDQGKFIRGYYGYYGLAKRVFKNIKTHIRKDLLRIPYSHLIMEMK